METLWFTLVAWMLTMYVLLDGFDLGAGALHLLAARDESGRRQILRSIGPVWDGNEVWLLAAGGTLYFAFPALYASSFSGFYLPLMIVLWLLILRGAAIEFRNHLRSPVWIPFWDVVFSGASALLAIFYGAALGNVVRGVPLDDSGHFFLPLWTDWLPGPEPGILDWYTVLAGVAALAALAHHGALWIALKTADPVASRARGIAGLLWYAVLGLTLVLTGATFRVQPHIPARLGEQPWIYLFAALALGGLLWSLLARRRGEDARAFLGSCLYLAGMLLSVAFGLYPNLLPSNTNPALSLTIYNAATGAYAMRVALYWWIPGMALVLFYTWFTYRRFAGKVRLEEEGY
ncbi:MAG: cytochrome d ubiquinol oxidase subunit II [Bryobacterales bacterium]|nr:cytochrome d ubiquinol oxidase subunit II [Bryobacteraceae bacterium]MDW8129134.1 cytochrome d ubiquinol oxidase subunit II [Bryobacterales bacterium]